MKILIGFLLTLFISSQAYAEQPLPNKHMQVLEEGKIIWETEKYTKKSRLMQKKFHVLYKAEYYKCYFDHYDVKFDEERYFSDKFVCVKQVPYAGSDSNF